MPSKPPVTPKMLASLRARYDAGEAIGALSKTLGISPSTFSRYRAAWKWPPRPTRKTLKQTSDATSEDDARVFAVTDAKKQSAREQNERALRLHARVLDVCEAEINAIEAGGGTPGGEPRARALAALTRTMASVRASMTAIESDMTGNRKDGEADEPPVDIAELRQELARRLHRLCEEGETS